MSEKRLPPSSRYRHPRKYARLLRFFLGLFGVFIVLIGIQDIFARVTYASQVAPAKTALPTSLLPTKPITPSRLIIPSIGVNAAVEEVGKNSTGAMATPTLFGDVAWYALGSKPGDAGNAVFAGHVNNALTRAGVFLHLADVDVGDKIVAEDSEGYALTFVVQRIEEYAPDDAPLQSIFTQNDAPGLVLITCDGDWDPKAHSFDKRLVVYATLGAV